MMMDAIQRIFEQTYDISQREPSLSFEIPSLGQFHFFGMALEVWLQLALAQCVSSIMNTLAAVLIYKFIVRQRGKMAAFLLGWSVIIPLVWYLPYTLLPHLKIANAGIVLGFMAFPAYVPFRCMEAMYGTSPQFCEASLESYIAYLASPIPFVFDWKTGRPKPTSSAELWNKSKQAVLTFVVTIAMFNILEPTNYTPFPKNLPHESFLEFLYWGNILNNYACAYLASVMLETGNLVFQIAISFLTGYITVGFNDRPLLSSSSPSDFWGNRWNQQVHSTLKRGVYKPLRLYFPTSIATFGTFFASGVLHDFIMLMTAHCAHNSNDYNPQIGFQLLFFLWNFAMVFLECVLRDNSTINYWSRRLPKPINTAIVLLTVLPISHWFTDEWANGGIFTGISLGFPRLVWIR